VRIALLTERMRAGFGADLAHHHIADHLARHGHRVTVFASVADGSYGEAAYELVRVPVPATTWFPGYEANARRALVPVLASSPDVVLVGTFPFFSLLPELAARVPCVAIDFGICSTEGFRLWTRLNFAYMRFTQHRRYFPHARRIVAISEFVRRELPRSLQDRTSVIYLGVDHYSDEDAREVRARELRRARGIGDDETLALYVGRLNPEGQPYKGTAELVRVYQEARKAAPGLRLMMAGVGGPEDERWLSGEGVIPYVNVPAAEMPALYTAADLYVTCSRWEGFDLPLAEAQFFGRPVLAYRIGAHDEVVRDGETGALVDGLAALGARLVELARDPALRERWGREGRRWIAATYPWTKTVERYGAFVEETAPDRAAPAGTPGPRVSVIVVNYNAPPDMMGRCLASLARQTFAGIEVLVVDNGSTNGSPAWIAAHHPEARLIELGRNTGFAGGVNRGVDAARGEYLLVSNCDVEYAPTAVAEMMAVLDAYPDTAGVAPKTLLSGDPDIIDNIGTLVTRHMSAFNMGIGHLDMGQYDRSERVFGLCFAAALIRAGVYRTLGGLDESLFMYYEDVDWCFRANIAGFHFRTAPAAVVHHVHSGITRRLDYGFKYELIHLNLLRTAVQDIGRWRHVAKTLAIVLTAHAKGVLLHRQWVRPTIRILARFVADLPRRLVRRARVQRTRVVGDPELWVMSSGEAPFFDPVGYQPLRCYEMLIRGYRRRYLLGGDQRDLERAELMARAAEAFSSSKQRTDPTLLKERMLEILRDEPGRVRRYTERI
jgi:GT2 family glycosyltransferase/glycosyltransferase involved in cell wall biosynthesis